MSDSFLTTWTVARQAVQGISLTRMLAWVAVFFSRESSQPRDLNYVFCNGRFFTTEPWGMHNEVKLPEIVPCTVITEKGSILLLAQVLRKYTKAFRGSVQFSHSVMSDSLWPYELQHARPPCPSPTPGVQSNSCPSSPWCHPAISSSVVPFSSCPQSLPASGSFQMSQLFTSDGQSTGVSTSTSVLPMNTQDWSALGYIGWISLQSKGLSTVFSNIIVQKHQFFVLSFLYSQTLISILDHWKNHSLN